jgi:hypothetical protein
MGILSRLLALFSGGSDESRLKKGIEEAKAGRPEIAIEMYDALLAKSSDVELRSQTLLNRALAYSALSDDGQAERDLKLVLSTQQASDGVKSTAREKLARVQKRMLRTQDRSNSRAT